MLSLRVRALGVLSYIGLTSGQKAPSSAQKSLRSLDSDIIINPAAPPPPRPTPRCRGILTDGGHMEGATAEVVLKAKIRWAWLHGVAAGGG